MLDNVRWTRKTNLKYAMETYFCGGLLIVVSLLYGVSINTSEYFFLSMYFKRQKLTLVLLWHPIRLNWLEMQTYRF